ncbi:hypothetical protein HYU06_00550 [Candidatus Woesearchaeota archaeon]|nr:hypothetical protein [Candidatus Woesearchaeota archaeon]
MPDALDTQNVGKIEDDILTDLGERIVELVELERELSKADEKREKARAIIMDKGILAQKSKRWQKLVRAVAMLEILQKKPEEFMQRKREYIRQLVGEATSGKEIKDKSLLEIASVIAKIDLPSPEFLRFLKDALVAVNKFGKNSADESSIREFNAEIAGYEAKVGQLPEEDNEQKQNKKSALDVIAMLKSLANENELYYLSAYRQDIEAWPQYAQTTSEGIGFFSTRVKEYIEGTEQATTNKGVRIKGLVSRFRDTKLWKLIEGNDAIKNLRTYPQQLKFYDMMRIYTESAAKDLNWEGTFKMPNGKDVKMPFLGPQGFYHNLDKGRNFIRLVRDHFGNHIFANDLERVKNAVHEQPVKFVEEFAKFEGIIKSPQHQIGVIHAAMQELNRILMLRILHLTQEMQKRVSEEERKIAKIIRGLGGEHESAVNALQHVIGKKKTDLEKEWNALTSAYEFTEGELVVRYLDESTEVNEIIELNLNLHGINIRYSENVRRQLEAAKNLKEFGSTITTGNFSPDDIISINTGFTEYLPTQAQLNNAILDNNKIEEILRQKGSANLPLILEKIQKLKELIQDYQKLHETIMKILQKLEIESNATESSTTSGNNLSSNNVNIKFPDKIV